MNLAFKLHKTHENHTINANTIHTNQTPPNLTFCMSLSKDKSTFSNLLKTKDKTSEFAEIYFCNCLPRGLGFPITQIIFRDRVLQR